MKVIMKKSRAEFRTEDLADIYLSESILKKDAYWRLMIELKNGEIFEIGEYGSSYAAYEVRDKIVAAENSGDSKVYI